MYHNMLHIFIKILSQNLNQHFLKLRLGKKSVIHAYQFWLWLLRNFMPERERFALFMLWGIFFSKFHEPNFTIPLSQNHTVKPLLDKFFWTEFTAHHWWYQIDTWHFMITLWFLQKSTAVPFQISPLRNSKITK